MLARIGQMDRAELRWRTSAALRTTATRLQTAVRSPAWDFTAPEHVLAHGLSAAGAAASIRRRPPRFVLDPASTAAMRDAILTRWPGAATDARVRADRMLRGEYDLLGYQRLRFGSNGDIDWHRDPVHGRRAPRRFWADVPYLDPAIGDHKVIWELNRHQHWMALERAFWLTGDTRYRERILHELRGWCAANPPLVGINWASMLEIGFRAMSWVWTLHALVNHEGDDEWLGPMLVALDRQLTHLEQNLSYYFSPNTHLTGEALALYVAGSALPELAASERWTQTGRSILLAEIDRQILPDGGHAERSTHYQRYTLDFYLLATLTAEATNDVEALAAFGHAARHLARFTRAMADDNGRLPLIGDDDGGMLWPLTGRACADVRDSLALAAVVLDDSQLASWELPEEVFWIAGPARAAAARQRLAGDDDVRPPTSRVLRDTGFAVLRDRHGSHAVLDAGPHGYMNAGHAHADALALTLTWQGVPLLIDPGTSTYTMNPRIRDLMRSSVSHNTVTIDGVSPALARGPFHWASRADARLDGAHVNPAFDWVEAAHDGYAPLALRRTVFRTGDAEWFIVDEVGGAGEHVVDTHWHFHPSWLIAVDDAQALRATHPEGGSAWLLTSGGGVDLLLGDTESGLGWHAPVYGMLVPAWTARIRRTAGTPIASATWIGAAAVRPALTCAVVGSGEIRVSIAKGASVSALVLRGPAARAMQYAEEGGRLRRLALADAATVVVAGEGQLIVESDEPVPDLHVAAHDTTLELAASVPPGRLRLRGSLIDMTRAVRLNGRELPQSPQPGESLLIHASDWRAKGTEGTEVTV